MNNYIGTYRVMAERDSEGNPVDDSTTYLVGTGSHRRTTIYRYNHDTLVFQKEGQFEPVEKWFAENSIEIHEVLRCNGEFRFRFNESYLQKVNEYVILKTTGAKTNPKSIKNHPNKDAIRQEKLDNLTEDEKEKRRLSGIRLKTARESAK